MVWHSLVLLVGLISPGFRGNIALAARLNLVCCQTNNQGYAYFAYVVTGGGGSSGKMLILLM